MLSAEVGLFNGLTSAHVALVHWIAISATANKLIRFFMVFSFPIEFPRALPQLVQFQPVKLTGKLRLKPPNIAHQLCATGEGIAEDTCIDITIVEVIVVGKIQTRRSDDCVGGRAGRRTRRAGCTTRLQ